MRARRERGGVGKGARGVVQFRVGITLDFRGDVATSPALSLPPPYPSSPSLPSSSSSSFSSPPSAASNPTSPSRISVSCVLPFQRAKATHPSYYGERAPTQTISGRDRSFRARYPIYRPRYEHIASDDISPSPAFGPDVAVRRRPASWRRTGIMSRKTFSFSRGASSE